MEKNYTTPKIKVRKVDYESPLLDNSLDPKNPTTGLPGDDNPGFGGISTGGNAGDAGAKPGIWSSQNSEE